MPNINEQLTAAMIATMVATMRSIKSTLSARLLLIRRLLDAECAEKGGGNSHYHLDDYSPDGFA